MKRTLEGTNRKEKNLWFRARMRTQMDRMWLMLAEERGVIVSAFSNIYWDQSWYSYYKPPVALSKVNRLQSRQDFRSVFREGIRSHGTHLTLRARSKAEADCSNQTCRLDWHRLVQKSASGLLFVTDQKAHSSGFSLFIAPFITWLAAGVVVQPSAVQEQCDYQQFLQELKQLLAEAEVLNGYSWGSLPWRWSSYWGFDYKCADWLTLIGLPLQLEQLSGHGYATALLTAGSLWLEVGRDAIARYIYSEIVKIVKVPFGFWGDMV